MGRLDEAETTLFDSLKLEPANHVALNEIEYIKDLRAGAPKAPGGLIRAEAGTTACEVCGRDVSSEDHPVFSAEGRVVHVCKSCEQKATKRWWQFWK